MMKTLLIANLSCVMVLLLGACSPAAVATPTSLPDTPTAAPTSTATAILPTTIPIAYVGGSLPCFAEPKINYDIVSTVEIIDQPVIVGIDSSKHFFAVRAEDKQAICWIEANYVTTNIKIEELAKIESTSTPVPPMPEVPTLVEANYTCDMDQRKVDAIIKWKPVPGVEGYHISFEEKVRAELGPDATEYRGTIRENINASASGYAIYVIEAYNATGSSSLQVPIKYYCNQ